MEIKKFPGATIRIEHLISKHFKAFQSDVHAAEFATSAPCWVHSRTGAESGGLVGGGGVDSSFRSAMFLFLHFTHIRYNIENL